MAKFTVPKLKSSTFKGWAFVAVTGLALAVLALIDRGGYDFRSADADGSSGCLLAVNVDTLNVRAGPSENAELVATLRQPQEVDGTSVVSGDFRQLEDGHWAFNQFLTPVAGTNCS